MSSDNTASIFLWVRPVSSLDDTGITLSAMDNGLFVFHLALTLEQTK